MANANLQYWQLMSVQAHVSWRLSQGVVVGSPVINGELVPSVSCCYIYSAEPESTIGLGGVHPAPRPWKACNTMHYILPPQLSRLVMNGSIFSVRLMARTDN